MRPKLTAQAALVFLILGAVTVLPAFYVGRETAAGPPKVMVKKPLPLRQWPAVRVRRELGKPDSQFEGTSLQLPGYQCSVYARTKQDDLLMHCAPPATPAYGA